MYTGQVCGYNEGTVIYQNEDGVVKIYAIGKSYFRELQGLFNTH